MATPKVMQLVDPHTGRMVCKVCGSSHDASMKHGGHYYRGCWQCVYKCKLASKDSPAYNGWTGKYVLNS